MNRKMRRTAVAVGRRDIAKGRYQVGHFTSQLCDQEFNCPLTDAEKAISAEIVSWLQATGPFWYHGGAAGRAVGDLLLPAAETGADPRDEGDSFLWRRNFTYITPDITLADRYARECGGVIYRICPLGEIEVDPTALRRHRLAYAFRKMKLRDEFHAFKEFCCPRAEVIEVVG